LLHLAFRWRVLRAVGALVQSVGGALDDSELSDAEKKVVGRRFWELVAVYRGKHRRLDG
jgi:hypothetical protein